MDTAQLLKEIVEQMNSATELANFNGGWNIAFKVAVLLLSIGAAVSAGLIAAKKDEAPPAYLTISNVVLPIIVTTLSAFAFTQFDFASRQAGWRNKANALNTLRIELQHENADPRDVVKRLKVVEAWDGDSPSSQKLPDPAI